MITRLFRVRVYPPTNYRGCRLGMVEMKDPLRFFKIESKDHAVSSEQQAIKMVRELLVETTGHNLRKLSPVSLKEGKYWTIYIVAEGWVKL